MQETGIGSILGERKKIILEVIVGVIVTLSLLGNAWALWDNLVKKMKDASYADGWKASLSQLIRRSQGCTQVDVEVDGVTDRFINVKCIAPAPAPAGERAAAPR